MSDIDSEVALCLSSDLETSDLVTVSDRHRQGGKKDRSLTSESSPQMGFWVDNSP